MENKLLEPEIVQFYIAYFGSWWSSKYSEFEGEEGFLLFYRYSSTFHGPGKRSVPSNKNF